MCKYVQGYAKICSKQGWKRVPFLLQSHSYTFRSLEIRILLWNHFPIPFSHKYLASAIPSQLKVLQTTIRWHAFSRTNTNTPIERRKTQVEIALSCMASFPMEAQQLENPFYKAITTFLLIFLFPFAAFSLFFIVRCSVSPLLNIFLPSIIFYIFIELILPVSKVTFPIR